MENKLFERESLNSNNISVSPSKIADRRVKYGTLKAKKYVQRKGKFDIEDQEQEIDLLNAAYPSLVETNEEQDVNLTSFEAYD